MRQASVDGESRFLLRFFAVNCWLFALAAPFMLFFGELHIPWWVMALIVVGLLLILPFLGIALWSQATSTKSDAAQLREHGRPAVAEIISLRKTRGRFGEQDTVALRLRISGDDITPFETGYHGFDQSRFRVGARVNAIVDPTNSMFTLKSR